MNISDLIFMFLIAPIAAVSIAFVVLNKYDK